jgi:hypothetical protein
VKQWILYILATIGMVVTALWAYDRLTKKSEPRQFVKVDIDDPGMEPLHFDSSKPDWSTEYVDGLPVRSLVTTYVKK